MTKLNQPKTPTSQRDFAYTLRSFLGYLEGTGKAAHTIKNYRLDLLSFHAYLTSAKGRGDLARVTPEDVEHFHARLRTQGLKTNTRRRKLLTIQRFLAYLSKRKKVDETLARKFPTPHKIERIPDTISSDKLIEAIRQLPSETLLDARNRALLWTLAETGCLVSEIAHLRGSDWKGRQVNIPGKAARGVPISGELAEAIERLERLSGAENPTSLFQGFNKFGSLGQPISSRGVELLVRHHAARLGFPKLTPRIFRHSVVIKWLAEGINRDEIQRRLGLKTAYAFRTYDALLSSKKPCKNNTKPS
ncbi:MAG: site-specific integrase [Oligoflexia bacterium]|nr:site-specific integrase [Oligoflexia bacterium]